MCISTTTLTSSPSGLTAAGQKQEACSSTGSLTRPSPSDRPRTTPSSLTLSLATRPPNWSEADTLLLEFRIGDRVAFRPSGQGQVEGVLTRYNKKTVTVITDDGRQWNVSPNFLSRGVSPETASPGGADVVLLGKR